MFAVALLVTLCCLLVLPILISKENYVLDDVHRAEAPGLFVELKLGKVHYQLDGDPDAPLVVLVHGFSAPSYMWDNNRTVIANAGYRVLTFDLFGRGYSSRPKSTMIKRFLLSKFES